MSTSIYTAVNLLIVHTFYPNSVQFKIQLHAEKFTLKISCPIFAASVLFFPFQKRSLQIFFYFISIQINPRSESEMQIFIFFSKTLNRIPSFFLLKKILAFISLQLTNQKLSFRPRILLDR